MAHDGELRAREIGADGAGVRSSGRADPALMEIALRGLTAARKVLPPALFYDEEGCRLFYEITKLPEYYLTRTETALLRRIGGALIPDGFHDGALVEFGGSDETKARYLLDQPGRPFISYVSIDVAAPALAAMRARLARSHPWLKVAPVTGDFMQALHLPPLPAARLGFFPGSTIGNLERTAAVRFLTAARRALGDGAWFVLGADLRKSPSVLLPAYNDSAGVTAAFNLNLLRRLNRDACADFDLDGFRHEATWNDRESRIEMHLVSRRAQVARIGKHEIPFDEGETIHTENSYKHTRPALEAIATEAGWAVVRVWSDPEEMFGVLLLRG